MPHFSKKESLNRSAHALSRARGFTLIEILVAISIIAVMSAILVTSFAKIKEGNNVATIKGSLKTVQLKAEVYYFRHLNRYFSKNAPNARGSDCLSAAKKNNYTNTIFGTNLITSLPEDTDVFDALNKAYAAAGKKNLICSIEPVTGAHYAIAIGLPNGRYWCVDNSGAARDTTNDTSPKLYDGLTSGDAPALDGATDYDCN